MQIISSHRPPDKYWHLKSVIKKKPFGTSLLYFLSFAFFFFFKFIYSIPHPPLLGFIFSLLFLTTAFLPPLQLGIFQPSLTDQFIDKW